MAQAWEDICRAGVPRLTATSALGRLGPWGPASRWWKADAPEWDVVSESIDGRRLLLGEAKWSARIPSTRDIEHLERALTTRRPPALPGRYSKHEIVRALLVPEIRSGTRRRRQGALAVTGSDLLR